MMNRRAPPAPQLPADLNAPEQAHELDKYGHDAAMTSMINPTPPTTSIRLKFRACAGAAWP